MVKQWTRRAIIFFGIVAIVPVGVLVHSYWTSISWRFGPAVDGQATASAWVDSNADGKRQPDEKPLAGVCMSADYAPHAGNFEPGRCGESSTDSQGRWGRFLAGGSCQDIYVVAEVPAGYQPTTDSVVKGCHVHFGFAPQGVAVAHKVLNLRAYIYQLESGQRTTVVIISIVVLAGGLLGTIWLEKPSRARNATDQATRPASQS